MVGGGDGGGGGGGLLLLCWDAVGVYKPNGNMAIEIKPIIVFVLLDSSRIT